MKQKKMTLKMKTIEAFKEKMKFFLKEVEAKPNKNWKKSTNTLKETKKKQSNSWKEQFKNLKTEREAIKKTTKLRDIWKWKIWVNDQELQKQI